MNTTDLGIHRDLSFDDYVAIDAANASTLNGFARTPAHVHYEMTHGGKKRTKALDLGWYLHLALIGVECEDFRCSPRIGEPK